jgi:UDP-glucose 4-epimerase
MKIEGERFLVTGGLGFIGRYLVRALVLRGATCTVLDRARGTEPIRDLVASGKVSVHHGSVLSHDLAAILRDCTSVFHLAASADVRAAEQNPSEVFENNVLATARLLDAMRAANVTRVGFTSTSTVYGEPGVVPTPEDHTPLEPISVYGASKLAAEGLLHGWAAHGGTAVVYRLANVVGGGASHGVVHDFVWKLRANPNELEILGREPGTHKSYVHINDTLRAMILAWSKVDAGVSEFNVGADDAITVKEVADAVCTAMGFQGVPYRWIGGADGGGWTGDVRRMRLSVERLKALGWRARYGSAEAVALAAKELAR